MRPSDGIVADTVNIPKLSPEVQLLRFCFCVFFHRPLWPVYFIDRFCVSDFC